VIVPGDIQRRNAVEAAAPHSDIPGLELLRAYADVFVDAHRRAPGGLSIEIGTRRGGSALLWLWLIDIMYQGAPRPVLFTVDPYGDKAYNGGDVVGGHFYGDEHYLAAKALLAGYPNHAHFLMTSLTFLGRMRGMSYWRRGEHRHAGEKDVTFAFLDGEHDVSTVNDELGWLWDNWMREGSLVLIDNVSNDPATRPFLEEAYKVDQITEQYAVISGRK